MIKKVAFNMPEDLFHEEPGYVGAFTRASALGAIRNGSLVVKVKTEPGDHNKIGARATVLGSIYNPGMGLLYFLEWEGLPGHAVACIAEKIAWVPS